MKVLIGCERSGIVRDAFRRMGHDALSCDLAPSDNGGPHYTGSVLDLIHEPWDLAIFHPPCTYLSSSGMHWNKRTPGRSEKTAAALQFVRALMAAPIERIAIENPIGCISTQIRRPDQILQPYQFGHDASKSTCLWLKNLTPLQGTQYIEPRTINGARRWANQTDSGQNRLGPGPERANERSRTYTGIAAAMAAAWG